MIMIICFSLPGVHRMVNLYQWQGGWIILFLWSGCCYFCMLGWSHAGRWNQEIWNSCENRSSYKRKILIFNIHTWELCIIIILKLSCETQLCSSWHKKCLEHCDNPLSSQSIMFIQFAKIWYYIYLNIKIISVCKYKIHHWMAIQQSVFKNIVIVIVLLYTMSPSNCNNFNYAFYLHCIGLKDWSSSKVPPSSTPTYHTASCSDFHV